MFDKNNEGQFLRLVQLGYKGFLNIIYMFYRKTYDNKSIIDAINVFLIYELKTKVLPWYKVIQILTYKKSASCFHNPKCYRKCSEILFCWNDIMCNNPSCRLIHCDREKQHFQSLWLIKSGMCSLFHKLIIIAFNGIFSSHCRKIKCSNINCKNQYTCTWIHEDNIRDKFLSLRSTKYSFEEILENYFPELFNVLKNKPNKTFYVWNDFAIYINWIYKAFSNCLNIGHRKYYYILHLIKDFDKKNNLLWTELSYIISDNILDNTIINYFLDDEESAFKLIRYLSRHAAARIH